MGGLSAEPEPVPGAGAGARARSWARSMQSTPACGARVVGRWAGRSGGGIGKKG